ncbi:MAG: YncE family protein [Pseudomonadota bacterium]
MLRHTLKPLVTAAVALLITTAAPSQTGGPAGYSVVSRIPGPDGGWDLLDIDPVAQRLYLARRAGVMSVDLASGKVTPDLVAGDGMHASMPVPGTSRVLSTNGDTNTVTIFDGVSGKVFAKLEVGTKPDAVAWDQATRTAWVMNPGSGDISVVDPLAEKVLGTITVGGSLELGIADGNGTLYVNVEDRNEVAVLDTRARKLLRRFPLNGCEGPTGIAYAPDQKLVISACANGVAVISKPDGHAVATLPVGPRPDGAAYDATRHLAFVPSGGDGTLYVIRLSPKPEVVQRLETARGARTIALDAATGRLYLPSARYETAAGASRPAMIPGSFSVLVVAPAP